MDISLTDLLLTAIVNHGAGLLTLLLFMGALGIPVPTTLLVIVAGVFVRQGVLDLSLTLGLALAGAVSGDSCSYWLGHLAKNQVQQRLGGSDAWQQARNLMQQHGGKAVYLTRFLLTPFAIPVNLVAGSSGYAFVRFLLFAVLGELSWLLSFGGLGYAFAEQWEAISQFVSDFSGLLVGVVVLATGVYSWRRRNRYRAAV